MAIHPTAIIDSTAEIDADVRIGPYCVVGPHVQIGAGSVLESHVNVEGWTTIGENAISSVLDPSAAVLKTSSTRVK